MAKKKAADRVRELFNSANSPVRWQWKMNRVCLHSLLIE